MRSQEREGEAGGKAETPGTVAVGRCQVGGGAHANEKAGGWSLDNAVLVDGTAAALEHKCTLVQSASATVGTPDEVSPSGPHPHAAALRHIMKVERRVRNGPRSQPINHAATALRSLHLRPGAERRPPALNSKYHSYPRIYSLHPDGAQELSPFLQLQLGYPRGQRTTTQKPTGSLEWVIDPANHQLERDSSVCTCACTVCTVQYINTHAM